MSAFIETDPGFASRLQALRPLLADFQPQVVKAVRLDQLPATSQFGHLAPAWLTGEEQQLFARFSQEKRKREWLAGRLAAKLALADWEGCSGGQQADWWHRWSILPDASGRPRVIPREARRPLPFLSISHSAGLAVALVAAGPCGIDIQQVSATASRARDRFSHQAEQAVLLALPCDETRRCTLLWSAKEALRKSLETDPLAGFRELELTSLTNSLPRGLSLFFSFHRASSVSLEVTAFFRNDYVCCLTATGHAQGKRT